MSPTHHSINYVELTVNNLAEAKTFYQRAFGWEFNDYGPGYAGIRGAGGVEVGGMVEAASASASASASDAAPAPAPAPAGTTSPFVILFSEDLDESLRGIVEAGGRILQGPYEFPGGRRLHFVDPSGNELGVWAER